MGEAGDLSWEKPVIVTSGAGFIGSHFVRLVRERHPDWPVVNLDLLTYGADLETWPRCWGRGSSTGRIRAGPWRGGARWRTASGSSGRRVAMCGFGGRGGRGAGAAAVRRVPL